MKQHFFLASIVLSFFVYSSCSKDKTPAPLEVDAICDTAKVYFRESILPVIVSNCAMSGCHDRNSHKGGHILLDYETILEAVEVGDPESSHLYETITENDNDKLMPPPPNQPLTSQQIDLVKKWIEQGAKNNTCNASGSTCNVTGIKYSVEVSTVLTNNCTGCHNPSGSVPSIDLTSYSGVKATVDNGTLLPAINYTGPNVMPPSSQLPQCTLDQIAAWINDGAPNN